MPSSFFCDNTKIALDVVVDYLPNTKKSETPLVIDNGSYQCRVGWATSCEPELNFKNVVAKNRGNKKERDWEVQVASEIADLEAVRYFLRTPYDFNVAVNYSVQETLFDYAFKHMGIDVDGSIPHPILLTEPIANPSYCRKNMSELLFECYSIPKLSYGIDCLFSYYFSNFQNIVPNTALIISSGFRTTHVVPIVNNYPDVKNSLRINLGGYNCSAYLQRLLQLKHSHCTAELTLTRMEHVIHNLCNVSSSYDEEVKKWLDTKFKTENTTALVFDSTSVNDSPKSLGLEETVKLEKKLKQAEYKLYEVECVIELEHENPDAAVKVAKDAGCGDLDQLKEKAEKIRLNIQSIRSELNELYHSDNGLIKQTVQCGIEKIQVPEIVFQPSLVGFDQCGISQCAELVLQRYSSEIQDSMAQNVFITGGNTKINGFRERVFNELQQLRPYQSKIHVIHADDPSTDAWKGAAKWAMTNHSYWTSRSDFEEFGWEYLKMHQFSNYWSKKM